ncbi:MAG: T9SS type A sorting domain-containing protein [Ignavibacteria bacterium]|nr:T9SS type A sorting domain-containing protein [Ignavibacteria bacterium]
MKNLKILILVLLFFPFILQSQSLYINEFMALNNTTIKDNFNSYEDWLEIYNPNAFSISMSGYKLTDDPINPLKWFFPDSLFIPAKGYLLIWASNRDTVVGNFIHTNFRLGASGEFIGLSSPTKIYIDSITFPEQTADISYGRRPDAGSIWTFYQLPTPGTSNDSTTKLPIPSPDFSHPSGIYSSNFQLTLSHPIGGASIYYTMDGSNPSTSSYLYSSPISISSTKVVRAIAYAAGRVPSSVSSISYIKQPSGNLPIFSLITDQANLYSPDSGIFVFYDSTGDKWERPISIHYFNRANMTQFEIDGGVRVHGGASRSFPKKPMRIYFESNFTSQKLNYKLFNNSTVEKFDRIVLKSGGNDMVQESWRWTLLRDQLLTDLYSKTRGYYSHGNYAQVFLNGTPHGIYNLREHISKSFLDNYMGVNDVDLRSSWVADYGDNVQWNTLWNFIWNNPVIDSAKFSYLESLVNVNDYIDYQIFEIWGGNDDWPHTNFYLAKERSAAGKWNWILWDTDRCFRTLNFSPYNNFDWALRDTVRKDLSFEDDPGKVVGTLMFRRFMTNQTFKDKFIARLTDLLNTDLQPLNVNRVLDSLKTHLINDISFETSKWGSNSTTWNANIDTVRFFINTRVDSIRKYVRDYFGITSMKNITIVNSNEAAGKVKIGDLTISHASWTGQYFKGVRVSVSALPSVGYKFIGWTDTTLPQTATFSKTISQDFTFQPIFQAEIPSSVIAANDVIINEYWLNDNGTKYTSIQNRGIQGSWIELLVAKEGGVDLRGWRITNNKTKTQKDPMIINEGSIVFNQVPQFSKIPKGTYILLITESKPLNDYYFPLDDLDYSDSSMVLYIRNGNLSTDFDPFFRLAEHNDRIALLHPGTSVDFSNDIGVDFISEGDSITPASFGISVNGVNFLNPLIGIGDDDGAIFVNSAVGIYNNDNGIDPIPGDNRPGIGGWIVDPSKEYSGDDPGNPLAVNILTPGKKNFFITTGVETEIIPTQFVLHQNYPNPFNPITRIRFSLPKTENVELKVYNILGQQVAVLLNETKIAGTHEIIFNSSDYRLASGVYIYHITAGDYKQSKKMLLLK